MYTTLKLKHCLLTRNEYMYCMQKDEAKRPVKNPLRLYVSTKMTEDSVVIRLAQ